MTMGAKALTGEDALLDRMAKIPASADAVADPMAAKKMDRAAPRPDNRVGSTVMMMRRRMDSMLMRGGGEKVTSMFCVSERMEFLSYTQCIAMCSHRLMDACDERSFFVFMILLLGGGCVARGGATSSHPPSISDHVISAFALTVVDHKPNHVLLQCFHD